MANRGEPVHTACGTGKAFWGPGDMYTFLITGEQTGGAYFVLEALVPPGAGPPPHIHHREDETFYVIEGTCRVWVGEETILASAGDFVHVPRGTVHGFRNDGDGTTRMIATFVPAGFEKFFEEVCEPAHDRTAPPPPPTQALIDRMIAAAPKYGLEMLPPPGKEGA